MSPYSGSGLEGNIHRSATGTVLVSSGRSVQMLY